MMEMDQVSANLSKQDTGHPAMPDPFLPDPTETR
jgi:hypothetical protein